MREEIRTLGRSMNLPMRKSQMPMMRTKKALTINESRHTFGTGLDLSIEHSDVDGYGTEY